MKRMLKQKRTARLRKARTRAKLFGTAERPRLSVFRSNKYVWAQLIDDAKGVTLAAASSRSKTTRPTSHGRSPGGRANTSESTKVRMKKTDAAYRTGETIAEHAKKLKISAAVFDRGAYRYHGRVKAVAEGARAGGLHI